MVLGGECRYVQPTALVPGKNGVSGASRLENEYWRGVLSRPSPPPSEARSAKEGCTILGIPSFRFGDAAATGGLESQAEAISPNP
jgi:hypothetical protein